MDKVQSLGDAREVGRLPGRDPACPHGSEAAMLHPFVTRSKSALRSATVANVKSGFAAEAVRRMKQHVCPAGRPSRVSARQPTYLFCFAKRRRREKATLRWRSAARTAHAASTEIGKRPKLAALRQRTLLYPISAPATWRHQRGFHCNGNGNGNGNGNFTCNGNCRCAELQTTATVAARSQPIPRGLSACCQG